MRLNRLSFLPKTTYMGRLRRPQVLAYSVRWTDGHYFYLRIDHNVRPPHGELPGYGVFRVRESVDWREHLIDERIGPIGGRW